jgi:hypothetical protein
MGLPGVAVTMTPRASEHGIRKKAKMARVLRSVYMSIHTYLRSGLEVCGTPPKAASCALPYLLLFILIMIRPRMHSSLPDVVYISKKKIS